MPESIRLSDVFFRSGCEEAARKPRGVCRHLNDLRNPRRQRSVPVRTHEGVVPHLSAVARAEPAEPWLPLEAAIILAADVRPGVHHLYEEEVARQIREVQ